MKASVCIGLLLLSLYGCSSTPQMVPLPVEVEAPIPMKLLETCELPQLFRSSKIEDVIITSVENSESHIKCHNKHNTLIEVLNKR